MRICHWLTRRAYRQVNRRVNRLGLALLATGSNAFGPVVERVRGDIFSSAESGNRQARIVKAIETLRPKGELGLIRNPRHIRHPRSRWDERDLVITPQPYTAKTARADSDPTGCRVRLRTMIANVEKILFWHLVLQ